MMGLRVILVGGLFLLVAILFVAPLFHGHPLPHRP
jgi:hypothetical protein